GCRVVQDVLRLPGGEVVQVLHGDDLGDLAGGAQLLHRDLGDAYVADLALLLQLDEGTELVGQGHLRIDPVQLDEVDGVQPQVPQRHLDLLLEVGGPADRRPYARSLPGQPRLGG